MSLTVLYVTGWCRSGSTLLGNVLNEIDGFFHAGELHYLWKNGVLGTGSNRACGCHLDLCRCLVWSRVLEAEVRPGVTVRSVAAAAGEWQRARFRTRHTWRVLRREPDEATAGHLCVMAAVYRAIQATTGARVIVDTSKFAAEAAGLLRLEAITPKVVHMVRDPRAVAYSWHRQKAYIHRMGAVDSTRYWVGFNLAAEAVNRRLPGSSLRLRYEDFTADPEGSVARVLALLGEAPGRSPVRGSEVTLGTNHTVTGNPDRWLTGAVRIHEDGGWREALPARAAIAATGLALPWLRRYGYGLGLRSSPPRGGREAS